MLDQCLQLALDDEYCNEARAKLEETGVKVLTNEKVVSINGKDAVESIELASGKKIKADLGYSGYRCYS